MVALSYYVACFVAHRGFYYYSSPTEPQVGHVLGFITSLCSVTLKPRKLPSLVSFTGLFFPFALLSISLRRFLMAETWKTVAIIGLKSLRSINSLY